MVRLDMGLKHPKAVRNVGKTSGAPDAQNGVSRDFAIPFVARRLLLFVAATAVLALPAAANVTDLRLSKSGGNVVLSWSTGFSPYRVLRSASPGFSTGNRTLADPQAASPFADVGAASPAIPGIYFYDVPSNGQPAPGAYDLNPPTPTPTITLLTPSSGQPGDTITIDGTNFSSDGAGMTVYFGPYVGTIIATSSTQITVQVPTDAVSCDVFVCVFTECSNTMQFKMQFGPNYIDISSLAFENGTGSLWIGDRGTADKVYELDSAEIQTIRASLNEAFVSNPSPSDGAGRIYYGNGLVNTANQGSINYVNSNDNSTAFFRAAGVPSTDPVYCRGLAARDSESDVAYILDGRLNTVRRVPKTGTIDANFGNTTFSFTNPSGGRFDAAGNLYVSSTSAIYKITPTEVVSAVASGFTAVAGIDLSEATGIPSILAADRTAGEVWLVNGESGAKTKVASGFSNPVAVAFSRNLTTGELYYDVAEPTRITRLLDPRIEFTLKTDVPVLIHKWGVDGDAYPNPFQTEDRKIVVEAKVTDGARGVAGVTVYFRVKDPRDKGGCVSGSANDNKGGTGTITPSNATTDAQGLVRATLEITDQFAGDNYQIEASFDPPASFKTAAQSGIFTAWKRAYIEHDRMYKVGEFVTQVSGAGQADPAKIFVGNPATFAVGDAVHIISGAAAGQDSSFNDGETPTVLSLGADHVVVSPALTKTYASAGNSDPLLATSPFTFLAKVSAGYYDTAPSSAKMDRAYRDAFVDTVFLSAGRSFLPAWPYMGGADDNARAAFLYGRTLLFFKHFDAGGTNLPKKNHIQLVSAGKWEASPGATVTLGKTAGDGVDPNWSWTFVQHIVDFAGFTNKQAVMEDTDRHEIGHEWNVNDITLPPTDPNRGHCSESGCGGTGSCLMNEGRNRESVNRFHKTTGAATKDLFCIRGHVDDLNQDTCTWP